MSSRLVQLHLAQPTQPAETLRPSIRTDPPPSRPALPPLLLPLPSNPPPLHRLFEPNICPLHTFPYRISPHRVIYPANAPRLVWKRTRWVELGGGLMQGVDAGGYGWGWEVS